MPTTRKLGQPLQTVPVSIPLGKGIDESQDSLKIQPPYALTAENCVFTKAGGLRKRRGFTQRSSVGPPSDDTGLNTIFERTGHAVMYGKGSVESYSAADVQWFSANNYNAYPAEVEFLHGFNSNSTIDSYDSAIGSATTDRVICEVWSSNDICWYRVVDQTNGAVMQPPTAIAGPTGMVSVVWNENSDRFILFGVDVANKDLYSAYMTPASALTISTPSVIVNAELINYSVKYSDVTTSNNTHLAYVDNTNRDLYYAVLDNAGQIATGASAAGLVPNIEACDVWPDDGNNAAYFATVDTSTGDVYLGVAAPSTTVFSATSTAKLSTNLAAVDQCSVAVAYTEDSQIFAAVSYVDDAVSGTQNSPTAADFILHSEAETIWALFNKGTFAAESDEHVINHYVLASQAVDIASVFPYDYEYPFLVLSYFFKDQYGEAYPGAPQEPEGVSQRHELLVTIDTTTQSVNSETGVPTGTVGLFPIVVAKINHDKADPDAYLTSTTTFRVLPHITSIIDIGVTVNSYSLTIPRLSLSAINQREGGTSIHFVPWVEYRSRPDVAYSSGIAQFVLGTRAYSVDITPPPVSTIGGEATSRISAGYVQAFDGSTLAEDTLFARPDVYRCYSTTGSGSVQPITGSGVPAGITQTRFYFRAVFVVRDANGQEHRTGPSRPFFCDIDQANANQTITAVLTQPGLTHWRLDRGVQIVCQLYAAEALADDAVGDSNPTEGTALLFSDSGGPYHLIKETSISPGAASISLSWDGTEPATTKASMSARKLLYTDGGVLAAESPPALRDLVKLPDRIVGISAENPYEILSTKRQSFGISPEWNGNLSTILSPTIKFVALANMDDKTIAFSDKNVYFIPVGSVDNTGQGALPPPQLIPSDTGCVNKRSVVEGTFGVIFQGRRGFYLLDRGLNLRYIGGPVEDTLVGRTINSAVLVPGEHVVRWTAEPGDSNEYGECFEYNYVVDAWSTPFERKAVSAALVGGTYWYCKNTTNGWRSFEENDASVTDYADAGTGANGSNQIDNKLVYETPWIKLSGMQGYQRVQEVSVLGIYRDAGGNTDLLGATTGGLQVELGFDYDPTYIDAYTWNISDDNHTKGDPFSIQCRPSQGYGKCSAIRVKVTELPSQDQTHFEAWGEGYWLSDITLLVGVSGGSTRETTAETGIAQGTQVGGG